MGESTTIAHALFTIVAVVMASVFAVAVLTQLNQLVNSINIMARDRSDYLRTQIAIVYAYYDSVSGQLVVFAKNTGSVPYSALDKMDVFVVDGGGRRDHYRSSDAAVGLELYEVGRPNNSWDPSETLRLTINAAGASYLVPIEVRLTLANGYTASYVVA